jgi:hypothetical protein
VTSHLATISNNSAITQSARSLLDAFELGIVSCGNFSCHCCRHFPITEHDIRLGDVVVSTPGPAAGAVIQYDLGKVLQGRSVVRTGSLNKPPPVVLNAINRLRAEHLLGGNNILVQLNRLGDEKTNAKSLFGKPGPDNDRLFEAEYAHPLDPNTCELCDATRLMKRTVREQDAPVIHYGSIASGNRVMKDAVERDKLREQYEVLCFEMEAAGLMDNFPCLVVRVYAIMSTLTRTKCGKVMLHLRLQRT